MRGQLPGCGDDVGPLPGVDVENPHTRQVKPVQQATVLGICQQDLAVGAGDVARECAAAPGGVDAGQHIPGQTGGGHGGQHLRGIAQQGADVQGAPGVGDPDDG